MQIPRRRIISFLILTLFTILLPLTGCSGGGSFGTTASQETFWNNVLLDTTNKGTGTTRDTLQGSTGIKPFWTYDTNAIGGGGKALVNLWGGNALVQYTDVSFPGRGLPVEIRRTYNSGKIKTKVLYVDVCCSYNLGAYAKRLQAAVTKSGMTYVGIDSFSSPTNTPIDFMLYHTNPNNNKASVQKAIEAMGTLNFPKASIERGYPAPQLKAYTP